MIEVIPHGNGWRWRWISSEGRTLLDNFETFPCNHSAFAAAKAIRTAFWKIADTIDHRQARAI